MNMTVEKLILSFLGILQTVSALTCYECSSLEDTKCGLLWGFKGDEADTYLHDCDQTATSCNKILGERQGNGEQHVYRKCWKMTTVENYTPSGCDEQHITGATFCHCSKDACNGCRVTTSLWSHIFSIVILSLIVEKLMSSFN